MSNVTFTMIKPDAVKKNNIGNILQMINQAGFRIIAMKYTQLSLEQAGKFYEVHKERPFYAELVEYMTSGPVMIMVLEGEDAIKKNRQLMGATDPKNAESGTIRADFGESIGSNAVHGSDGVEGCAKPQCCRRRTMDCARHRR